MKACSVRRGQRGSPAAPTGASRRIASWRRSAAKNSSAQGRAVAARDLVAGALDRVDQMPGFANELLRGRLRAEFGQHRSNAFAGRVERPQRAVQVVLVPDRRYVEVRQDLPDSVEPFDGRIDGRLGPDGIVIDAGGCAEQIHT